MSGWRKSLLRWTGAVATGLTGAASASAGAAADRVADSFLPAAAAPAAWQAFAQRLGSRFQDTLATADVARELSGALAARAKSTPAAAGNAAADVLPVQAWVLPDGQIERVEFGTIDPLVAARLRVLLSAVNVGAPPPDLLQPVHVRLLLRPGDHNGQER